MLLARVLWCARYCIFLEFYPFIHTASVFQITYNSFHFTTSLYELITCFDYMVWFRLMIILQKTVITRGQYSAWKSEVF